MKELVKIHDYKGQEVVSARDLHAVLESKQDFSTWIKSRIEKYGFIENQDYTTFHKIVERAKRKEYATTLDMAKELSMVEANEQGQIARRYFIAVEKKAKQQLGSNLSRLQIIEIAREAEMEAIELRKENKSLSHKASFADRVIDDEKHLVDIGQAAKLLKLPIGRNKFFAKLREDGIFFKNRNEPKQQYINKYFELREKTVKRESHDDFTITKVLVNQKGLFWLSKRYGGAFESGIPDLDVA